VSEVDYHPGYVKGGSPASVDIGLVFLQQEVKFGPTIQARVETEMASSTMIRNKEFFEAISEI
jgi:hypothetical protein